MNALRQHHECTLDEYFEVELQSTVRFEFRGGAILAMSGGSWRHDDVSLAVGAALRRRFRGTCRAFGPNLRILTGDGTYTYADAGVVCGRQELAKHRGTDTLLNPTLIVEVLSASTRAYDLGEKLESYRATPSIREILLVEAESVDVHHTFRDGDGWQTVRHRAPTDVIRLHIGDATLPLDELYETPPEPT